MRINLTIPQIHPILFPPVRVSNPVPGPTRASSSGRPTSFNRQGLFDARAQRRDGDWSDLGISAVLLWAEEDAALNEVDDSLAADFWSGLPGAL
jgi:hypothetical protein